MKRTPYTVLLILALLLLFILDITVGSTNIAIGEVYQWLFSSPSSDINHKILSEIRLPKAMTACLAGSSLAVSGLMMQSIFRNPLAGPFVLGITSGASLGVAISIMLSSVLVSFNIFIGGLLGTTVSAVLGAVLILLLISYSANIVKNNTMLLIIGLMFSYIAGALVAGIQFYSNANDLQSFVIWGMGSFGKVTLSEVKVFAIITIITLLISFFLSKPLDILLFGEDYAKSLGLNIKVSRLMIILVSGFLGGCTTAFCGPIAFIGIAVPHLVKLLLKNSSNHKLLIPHVALMGALVAVFCDLIAQLPSYATVLPINVITSILGAPIVIWIIIRHKAKYQNS